MILFLAYRYNKSCNSLVLLKNVSLSTTLNKSNINELCSLHYTLIYITLFIYKMFITK